MKKKFNNQVQVYTSKQRRMQLSLEIVTCFHWALFTSQFFSTDYFFAQKKRKLLVNSNIFRHSIVYETESGKKKKKELF